MVNRSRAKGTAAETAVVDYLRATGWPYAERRALNGSRDRGDIAGIPGVVIEVKAGPLVELSTWMKELHHEMVNDNTHVGFLAVKPRGVTDAARYYGVVPMPVLVALLKEAGW